MNKIIFPSADYLCCSSNQTDARNSNRLISGVHSYRKLRIASPPFQCPVKLSYSERKLYIISPFARDLAKGLIVYDRS